MWRIVGISGGTDILPRTDEPGIGVSQPTTLGELIRERRLAHGMSLSQFATRMDVTTAEARRWERSESTPIPFARVPLGNVLDLPPEVLDAVWPSPEQGGTVDASSPVDTEDEGPEDPLDTYLAAGGVVVATGSPAASDDEPGAEVESGRRDDTDEVVPAAMLTEEPTQAIGVPFVMATPAPTDTALFTVVEPDPPSRWNPFRYVYDPDRPWLYYLRTLMTLVVLAGLAFVLWRSLGLLLDALGELLDTIATDSDQVESTIETLEGATPLSGRP